MRPLQVFIDSWFERGRGARPKLHYAYTRDGWRIALHRFLPRRGTHRTPVILCHGMSSNRWDMDGPGRVSMARYLLRRGYDVWVVELRGAGRSMRPTWTNGKRYDWTFEDYVQHDAAAALSLVLHATRAPAVHWVGHSMGGMIAYALLMSPASRTIASAVTLGSPSMSEVGHPLLDFGVPYSWLLRFLPARLWIGTLARLASPLAPLLARLFARSIRQLGWTAGNADLSLLRTLMLTAVDDLPNSLLYEFAQWYEHKAMHDRYALFDFAEHLERITAPILIIAGNKDGLTPARDLECVYRAVASPDKSFRVIGKEYGFAHDYSHVDLVLGLHAPEDVYPLVLKWLDEHRQQTAQRGRRSAARAGAPGPRIALPHVLHSRQA